MCKHFAYIDLDKMLLKLIPPGAFLDFAIFKMWLIENVKLHVWLSYFFRAVLTSEGRAVVSRTELAPWLSPSWLCGSGQISYPLWPSVLACGFGGKWSINLLGTLFAPCLGHFSNCLRISTEEITEYIITVVIILRLVPVKMQHLSNPSNRQTHTLRHRTFAILHRTFAILSQSQF